MLDASLYGRVAAEAVDLRPAGDARADLMLDHVQGDALLEPVDEKGELGARPDETHVALEDVEELRQLVDGEFADERAEFRLARVGVGAPAGRLPVVYAHGAEFVHVKRLFVQSDALLLEQDGAGRGELDADRREQHERRGADDQYQRPDDVHGALEEGVADVVERNVAQIDERNAADLVDRRARGHEFVVERDEGYLNAVFLAARDDAL